MQKSAFVTCPALPAPPASVPPLLGLSSGEELGSLRFLKSGNSMADFKNMQTCDFDYTRFYPMLHRLGSTQRIPQDEKKSNAYWEGRGLR